MGNEFFQKQRERDISGLSAWVEPVPKDATRLGSGVAGNNAATSRVAIDTGLLYVSPPSWKLPRPSMSCDFR